MWWARLLTKPHLRAAYRSARVPGLIDATWLASGGVTPDDARLLGLSERDLWDVAGPLRGRDRDTIWFGANFVRIRGHRGRSVTAGELALFIDLDPATRGAVEFYADRPLTNPLVLSAVVSALPVSLARQWVDSCAFYDLGHLIAGTGEEAALPVLVHAWSAGPLRQSLASQGERCDYYDVSVCAARLEAWLDVPDIQRELRQENGPDAVVHRIIDWAGVPTPWAWLAAGYTPTEATALTASNPDVADVLATMTALRQPGASAPEMENPS